MQATRSAPDHPRRRSLPGFLQGSALKHALLPALLIAAWAAFLGGCSSPQSAVGDDPTSLQIDGGQYEDAFEAAVRISRERGFEPSLRDLRAGVMETGPRRAATIGEFWNGDGSTMTARMQATAQHLQHRLRFEFVPVGPEAPELPTDAQDLPGPDLLGFKDSPLDLTTWPGPLEVRIWAWLERPHLFGVRRHPWSLTLSRGSREGGLIDAPWTWNLPRDQSVSAAQPHAALEILGRDHDYERSVHRSMTRVLAPTSTATAWPATD